MSDFILGQLQIGPFICLLIVLAIALSNLRALRRLENAPPPPRFPRAAILVPARNEALNIEACVRTLLAQEYPDFEVLALDDHSTDGTGAILARLAAENPRLRVLQGAPLPEGWFGKHWACEQLAAATDAEVVLFTDADTLHHPRALHDAVAALLWQDADLVAGMPAQDMHTWPERLVVPVLTWAVFCFVPVALAEWRPTPALSATIGQFMLFRRAAYRQIGGHAAVRRNAADDLALGRLIIAHGLRWRLFDATARVRCRMYRSTSQVLEGFSKNLYAAFGFRAPVFLWVWLWLAFVFLAPLGVTLAGLAGAPLPADARVLSAVDVALALALWTIFHARFGFPLYRALLYPLTIGLTVLIALRSLVLTLTGTATWKGRVLAGQRERHA